MDEGGPGGPEERGRAGLRDRGAVVFDEEPRPY